MQIIIILETFKDFFSCKLSWPQVIIIPKIVKIFLACKIVLDANHHYPEIIQRFFRWQSCLRRRSSLSWKYSKTFLTAKLSYTQIIIMLKVFKDFFACKIVFDANHHHPENIQRFFACKIVLDANHHYPGNIQRLFLLQIVLAAYHHYPENFQNSSRLQNWLRRKSSLSWKNSKTFSPANFS